MDSIFDNFIYIELREKRINAIINFFGKDWFSNKKILELGCGHADVGIEFYKLGSDVTSTDVREEHLKVVNEKYPQLKTILFNLESPEWPFEEKYDLIIHIGTLYHLNNYEKNLENCLNHCDYLFLESIVSDSDDENFVRYISEKGDDQSFVQIGSRASEKNIEKIIKNNNFIFHRHFSSNLNSTNNIFDWVIKNTQDCVVNGCNARRSWFCENTFKSQNGQDKYLLSLIGEKKNGYFVELGACDGELYSNSFYFEKVLEWNGILIEPNPIYWEILNKNRNCNISNKLCDSVGGNEVNFLLADAMSGIINDNPGYWVKYHIEKDKIKLKTSLLSEVLDEFKAPLNIDFLSLDVEGSEYDILSTFPFDKYTFDFMCIEHNERWRKDDNKFKIRDILINNGYKLIRETDLDDFYKKIL